MAAHHGDPVVGAEVRHAVFEDARHVLGVEILEIIGGVTADFGQRRQVRQEYRFTVVHGFDDGQAEAFGQ